MNVGPQIVSNLKIVGFAAPLLRYLHISEYPQELRFAKCILSSSHIFEIKTRILNIVSSIFDTIEQEEHQQFLDLELVPFDIVRVNTLNY